MPDGIDRARKRKHSAATKRGLKRAKRAKKEERARLHQDRKLDKAAIVSRRFFGGAAGATDERPPATVRVAVTLRIAPSVDR